MKTLKAILIMSIWTSIVGFILYTVEAHLHFREIIWAVAIGVILLITHMVNMALYFKIAGKEPYLWFKQED
jgi:hypothetical protein|tara:strand:+ start:2562 stop:2774 length:213 start_codon:yes stop_codon:yes gene_type:complete